MLPRSSLIASGNNKGKEHQNLYGRVSINLYCSSCWELCMQVILLPFAAETISELQGLPSVHVSSLCLAVTVAADSDLAVLIAV